MPNLQPIRILLVDDHYVVRMGIKAILASAADMEVVAEAEDGEKAAVLDVEHKPDVILMDLRLPGIDGTEATKRILHRRPKAKVLMLTTYDGDQDIHGGLQAGASGYIFKSTAAPGMLDAIRRVHAGLRHVPADVSVRLSERPPCSDLSERQRDVLQLVAKGFRNREIASVLSVSENTIKTHVTEILGKLGASDRTEAAYIAIERGIIHV